MSNVLKNADHSGFMVRVTKDNPRNEKLIPIEELTGHSTAVIDTTIIDTKLQEIEQRVKDKLGQIDAHAQFEKDNPDIEPIPQFLTKNAQPPPQPVPSQISAIDEKRLADLEKQVATMGRMMDQMAARAVQRPEIVSDSFAHPLPTSPSDKIRIAFHRALASVSDNQIRYELAFKARNGNTFSAAKLKTEADLYGITVEQLCSTIMNERDRNENKTIRLIAHGPRIIASVDAAMPDQVESALAMALEDINTLVGG